MSLLSSNFFAPPGLDVSELMAPLCALEAEGATQWGTKFELTTLCTFEDGGIQRSIPRVRIRGGASGTDLIRLAIVAGIHGDEPAGCSAVIRLAERLTRRPEFLARYELFLFPVLNPAGYANGTRSNHRGKDLNREFWRDSQESEVAAMESELRQRRFDGIITLHADDTCEGVYGYAHGRTLNEALMVPALDAAREFLPVDDRATIDGFPARAGLICDCFAGVLSAPPEQSPKPFDLIFETPAHAPFDLQVDATVAALEAIMAIYPGFISYAQDL
jgi:hypothetical protein